MPHSEFSEIYFLPDVKSTTFYAIAFWNVKRYPPVHRSSKIRLITRHRDRSLSAWKNITSYKHLTFIAHRTIGSICLMKMIKNYRNFVLKYSFFFSQYKINCYFVPRPDVCFLKLVRTAVLCSVKQHWCSILKNSCGQNILISL